MEMFHLPGAQLGLSTTTLGLNLSVCFVALLQVCTLYIILVYNCFFPLPSLKFGGSERSNVDEFWGSRNGFRVENKCITKAIRLNSDHEFDPDFTSGVSSPVQLKQLKTYTYIPKLLQSHQQLLTFSINNIYNILQLSVHMDFQAGDSCCLDYKND